MKYKQGNICELESFGKRDGLVKVLRLAVGTRFEKLAEPGADKYVPEGQSGQLGSHEMDSLQDGKTAVDQQAGPAPIAAETAGGFQLLQADIDGQVGGEFLQLAE